jgi:ribosomal protein L11 methyltransferase
MSYLAYKFIVSPAQPGSEILVAMIADFGFDSFDYNENGFTAYIIEENSSNIDLSEFQFDDFNFTYSIEKIETKNWNEEWEKNFEPVFVDDLLCIRAPFHEKQSCVKKEIVIMPKMSFGTGHHQTTRLMCKQMFNNDFTDKRVLDMGTGTGILAILAKMLHAKEVVGIDIDEWSVENAIENCAANGYSNIILKKGDVDFLKNETPFDIILANINKNILKAQIPIYSNIAHSNSLLFLSGFFTTDVDELVSVASEHKFKFLKTIHENEWAMVLLERI